MTTTSSEGGEHHARQYYQSSSHAFRRDRNQVELLAEENRKLRQQNLVLQTEVSTIKYTIQQASQALFNLTIITFRDLYHTLTQNLPRVFSPAIQKQSANFPPTSANSALPSMSTPNACDQPLNHNDYPNVRFWFRKDWINRKKETSGITKVNQSNAFTTTEQSKASKGRAPSGVNVTLRYVEDIHGVVVDGFRASEMRKFARAIWNQLEGSGKAPKSWGKADLDVATHYRREMRRRFPELALCEFDWKAEQIATDNYPNWASNNLQGVKLEPSEPSSTHNKQRRDSVGQISKRAKTESIPPTTIDIDSSTNVISNATNLPPIDPGIIITPANILHSSVTQPATLPSITVSVHTTAPPNIEAEAEELRSTNVPANVAPDRPNELPADPVPTDGTLALIDINQLNSELGEDDTLPVPTAVSTATPFTTDVDAPPSSDVVLNDGLGAAAKTTNSSQAASMPRVHMSSNYFIICSRVVT